MRVQLFQQLSAVLYQRVTALLQPCPDINLRVVGDWAAAQTAIETAQCDLTLLALPGLAETLRFILWAQEHQHPVVVLDESEDLAQEAMVLRAGAADYLSASISTDTLRRSLRQAILRADPLRELASKLRLYEEAIDEQQVMVCRFAPDGTLIYVNQVYSDYYQTPAEQLIGKNVRQLVYPDDLPRLQENDSVFNPQAGTQVENRTLRPDGQVRWTHWHLHPAYDQRGKLQEIHATGQDIHPRKMAELALAQEKAQLQAITRNMRGFAVLLFDPDMRYLLAEGELVYENAHFPKSMLEGATVKEIAGHHAPRLEAAYHRALAGETLRFDIFQERFYEFTVLPIVQEDGSIPIGLVIVQDVHEQRTAAAALEQSEARYRAVVEDQLDFVARFTAELSLTFVNDAYCNFYGKTREELLGSSLLDLAHPDAHAPLKEALGKLSPEQATITLQEQALKPNEQGEGRWVEWTNRALFNEQGQVIEYQSVGRDITVRRRVQMEIQRQADILNMIHDAVITIDAQGNILSWNGGAERLYGLGASSVLGKPLRDIIKLDDVSSHHTDAFKAIQEHGFYQGEQRHYNAIGKALDVMVTLSHPPSIEIDKQVMMVVSDISALKQQEKDRLAFITQKERIRVLRQFIGNSTHDLMTPLSTMKTSLYLLERARSIEDQARYHQKLNLHLDKMEKLLSSMLDVLRLEAEGPSEWAQEPLNVNTVVESTFARHRSTYSSKGHLLTLQLCQEGLIIEGDELLLRHVVEEVLMNAFQYTPVEGQISVQTARVGDMAEIRVRDSGEGIPPDDLPHIFDLFYRVDKARNAQKGGAGLGLALAQGSIAHMGGSLQVESKVQQGSTFIIQLPLLSGAQSRSESR